MKYLCFLSLLLLTTSCNIGSSDAYITPEKAIFNVDGYWVECEMQYASYWVNGINCNDGNTYYNIVNYKKRK